MGSGMKKIIFSVILGRFRNPVQSLVVINVTGLEKTHMCGVWTCGSKRKTVRESQKIKSF